MPRKTVFKGKGNSSSKQAVRDDIKDPLAATKNTVLMDHRHMTPTLTSYLCMFFSLGWIITIPVILMTIPFLWQHNRMWCYVLLGSIALSAVYTAERDYQPRIGYIIGDFIMKNVSSYFQFRAEFENLDAIKKAGAAIYIMEPHGVFPIALFWGSLDLIPGMRMLCCLSSSIFTIPFMKHVLTWCGATNIAKENISRYLKEGVSVNICAGGVQEIPYWGEISKEMVLFLKTRYGVTKLAMTHGVCIVPSICFGLENAYGCWIFSHPLILQFARKIGFFPMLFTGLFGIPFGQPKPCPLCAVIGTPIKVTAIENPTQEQVAEQHQLLLDAYRKLFDDNKGRFGMSHQLCSRIDIFEVETK